MPAKLNIQTQDSNRKYEKASSPDDGRPRVGRSNPAAPSRGFSQREPPALQRRPTRPIEEQEEADRADLYDMYQGGGGSRASRDNRPSRSRQQRRYVDDDDASDYDDGSLDGAEFEMVSNNRRGQGSRSGSRAPSRRPEIRKIRVKVHAEEVRYIMIGTAIEFSDFTDRIRDKFGLRRRFKIKIKDEDVPDGDMITIGDYDDLEMAIQSSTGMARRQRQDIGKMEVRNCGI